MSLRAVGLVFLPVLLAACPGPDWVSVSSTIAVDRAVWITSPDENAVLSIDLETLAELTRSNGFPGASHLVLEDGLVRVSTGTGSAVDAVDRDGVPLERAAVPCGGVSALAGLPDGRVWVACPQDDLVLELGGASLSVPRPGALAIVDDVLHVASRDRILRFDLSTMELLGEDLVDRPPGASVIPITTLAVDPSGAVAAIYTVVDNNDRDRPPEDGGYGSVVDGEPRIQPWISHPDCGGPYAIFDGGERVFSDPAAAAFDPSGRLWIAHRGTQNVAVLECDRRVVPATETLAPLVANQRIGAGARGIAIAPDGESAFVDVGFDHAIAHVTLEAEPRSVARAGSFGLSEAAQRGRRAFFDATNTHATPSGIVTCGICHPSGGEDGLSWFLHTPGVARKVRRTPPVWSVDATVKPLHWDGEFGDAETLVGTTIRELMGGDALVISTADVAAFMAELPPPPGVPGDPEELAAAALIFGSAGCAECHAGDAFTDGQPHSVVAPAGDADADLDAVITPRLRGVRAHGPWLHDGRAPTLRSLFEEHNPADTHGTTTALSASEIDALILYLESL